jgi:hypothetical protein
MKTQTANSNTITSNRPNGLASIAAVVFLMSVAGAAQSATPVVVTNLPTSPVYTSPARPTTQGMHIPVEYHFGQGQVASIASPGIGFRLVIEHVNIQNFDSSQWLIELAGTGSGVYTNTAFLLTPVSFSNGARYLGVVTSTGRMFANYGTTLQFNFSNASTFNATTVPANVFVEVWGYFENAATASSPDDF